MTPIGPVTFPITTTDVTPFVTQLAEKNPDTTTLVGSPQNVGQWLAAEQRLGKATPTCTSDALTPPQVLIGLGPALTDFYTAASFPDPAWSGYPMLTQFREQAAAEVAAGDDVSESRTHQQPDRGSHRVDGCTGPHPGSRQRDRRQSPRRRFWTRSITRRSRSVRTSH